MIYNNFFKKCTNNYIQFLFFKFKKLLIYILHIFSTLITKFNNNEIGSKKNFKKFNLKTALYLLIKYGYSYDLNYITLIYFF